MKDKEALEWCEMFTNNLVTADVDTKRRTLGLQAMDRCKKALEKQIQKHIEEQTEDDREFIDYVCPNCKTTLQQKKKGATRTTIFKYKYCHWCGQCLEWD